MPWGPDAWILALHAPDLPLEAILRHHPEKRRHPHAILTTPIGHHASCVAHANRPARRLGVHPGLSPTRALARCPALHVLDRDPDAEAAALGDLLHLAESLTPDFELTTPDTLILDCGGGGPPQAVVAAARRGHQPRRKAPHSSTFHSRASGLGLPLQLATGPTPDLAHLLSLHPATSQVLAFHGAESRWKPPSPLPNPLAAIPLPLLQNLGFNLPNLTLLHQWGLQTCAQLAELPRQELVERLGPDIAPLHDLLHAKFPRFLNLFKPIEAIDSIIHFDQPIQSAESLVLWLKRALQTLCGRLASNYRPASEIELVLELETPPSHHYLHRLPEPSGSPEILLRPLATHLEQLHLPAPVTGFRLQLTPSDAPSGQHGLFDRGIAHPHRLADTLVRLTALLGDDRLGFPVPAFSHRPDSFHLLPAHQLFHERGCGLLPQAVPAASVRISTPSRGAAAPIPTDHGSRVTAHSGPPLSRFRPPIEIAVAFESARPHPVPLALLSGPHRGRILDRRGPFPLSGNWWDPSEKWQQLEWDILLDTRHLLRLAHIPPDRWHLQGGYP